MEHSYEDIRAVAIDVLAGREKVNYDPTQYASLQSDVAEVLARREQATVPSGRGFLSRADSLIFQEVFWDLFLQRIITIGLDDTTREFPFFRLSSYGKRILANQDTYFYHDVSSYEKLLLAEV